MNETVNSKIHKPLAVYESETGGYERGGYEQTGYMGEKNSKNDTLTGGRARNMENKK
jgi:hypothetical protein